MKFRKKPVVIEAWRIDPLSDSRPEWVSSAMLPSDDGSEPADRVGGLDWCPSGEGLYINTLEGHMLGGLGDWLIKGVKGELYACKPDIFEATYEPAE
jgi:hypothetical protein